MLEALDELIRRPDRLIAAHEPRHEIYRFLESTHDRLREGELVVGDPAQDRLTCPAKGLHVGQIDRTRRTLQRVDFPKRGFHDYARLLGR